MARWVLWSVSLPLVWPLLFCAGAEQETLRKFFQATVHDGPSTVARVSLYEFPGPVESWEVLEVTEASLEPFPLPELRRLEAAAEQARDAQFAAFSKFRLANYDDLLKVEMILEQDPEHRFSGKLATLRAEWERFREERRELERALRNIRKKIAVEKKPAMMSLLTSTDIALFDGDVQSRKVLTKVRAPDGEDAHYWITLKRYNLTHRQTDVTPPTRWIITDIQRAPGGDRQS